MPNCTKCGARVDADDEFCPDCGAKIRAQPTEALPARQAMLIAVQPKKHWFLKTVLIFIVIIFLARACANFASEPQIYSPAQEVAAPAESDRLISIETPPPRVNPIPEPEPLLNKDAECSGVSINIIDSCFSCGVVDCGLLAKVQNIGNKPIISFVTRSYVNEMNKDESKSYEPLDIGMSAEISVYKTSNEIRMIELIPVIVVGGKEITCESQATKYGNANAYGSVFSDCGTYTDNSGIQSIVTTPGGYDATYDMGY